jgi:hypothetical protein
MNDLICKSKSAALSALDTIAAGMGAGTQRAAILAVKEWIVENTQGEQSQDEIRAELRRIFEGDNSDRLAREWKARGGPPPHGARIKCLWNSETKEWEPEVIPPEMPGP